MVQGHHRLEPVFPEGLKDLLIMKECRLAPLPLPWLYAAPFDGKTVCIVMERLCNFEIVFKPFLMLARLARFFFDATFCFPFPPVIKSVVPFHLMGRCGASPQEVFREGDRLQGMLD